MNAKITIISSSITFTIGMLLFALHYQWIIIRFSQPILRVEQQIKTKKICTLHFWHNNRWTQESQELIWSSTLDENVSALVTNWLTLLDTESILPKKITLQSVALSPNKQELYLSFDRNLLPKQWAVHRKWMLIEGLLRTLRANSVALQAVHFLVHHQPLTDTHLDFSFAWPINGFVSS